MNEWRKLNEICSPNVTRDNPLEVFEVEWCSVLQLTSNCESLISILNCLRCECNRRSAKTEVLCYKLLIINVNLCIGFQRRILNYLSNAIWMIWRLKNERYITHDIYTITPVGCKLHYNYLPLYCIIHVLW